MNFKNPLKLTNSKPFLKDETDLEDLSSSGKKFHILTLLTEKLNFLLSYLNLGKYSKSRRLDRVMDGGGATKNSSGSSNPFFKILNVKMASKWIRRSSSCSRLRSFSRFS